MEGEGQAKGAGGCGDEEAHTPLDDEIVNSDEGN
jgi:hypothetical protein